MSNFLDYIRTIFKLSGSQALPSGSYINFDIPPSKQWSQSYTASFDGYVELFGLDFVAVELSNVTSTIRTKSQTTKSAGCFMPVKKGDVFNVYVDYSSTANAWFRLVKTVGSS